MTQGVWTKKAFTNLRYICGRRQNCHTFQSQGTKYKKRYTNAYDICPKKIGGEYTQIALNRNIFYTFKEMYVQSAGANLLYVWMASLIKK